MAKGNYINRKSEGPKLGQIVAKDLRKHAATFASKPVEKRECTSLELSLQGKNLTDEGLQEVSAGLTDALQFLEGVSAYRLDELNLSNNGLTTAALANLAPALRLASYDLRDLDLSGNKIKVTNEEEARQWEQFLDAFEGCRVLRRIDLSNNNLSGPLPFEVMTRVYFRHTPVDPTEIEGLGPGSLDTVPDEDGPVSPLTRRTEKLSVSSRKDSANSDGPFDLSGSLSGATVLKRRCGLRSIPYIVLSNTNMDDSGALHLSYILSQHYYPQHLMSQLQHTKATLQLEELHSSVHCWGLVYLPNDKLNWAAKALEHAEAVRQELLGLDDYGEPQDPGSYVVVSAMQSTNGLRQVLSGFPSMNTLLTEPSRQPSLASTKTPRRRNSMRSSGSGFSLHSSSPAMKKDAVSQLESSRRKLQRETIEQGGPVKVQLWSAALEMIRLTRALLLPPKDGCLQPGEDQPVHGFASEMIATAAPPNEPIFAITGVSHTPTRPLVLDLTKPLVTDFQRLPPSSPPAAGRSLLSENLSPTTKPMKATIALDELPYKDPQMPQSLLEETWHRIIAHAVGAHGIMSERQQRAAIEYAKDRGTLVREMDRLGMNESAQVWHVLEAVGCLAYEMRV